MKDLHTSPRHTNDSTIARIRAEKCVTQAQLARLLGVAPQQISRWERNSPKVATLKRIGEALGVDWKLLVE